MEEELVVPSVLSRGHRRRRAALAVIGTGVLVSSLGWLAPTALAGATIAVTTTDQEVNDDGDCSLQEAIYAANFDANIAPSFLDDSFFTTGCTAGSGADTIELPTNGVFLMSSVIDDLHNPFGPTATPIVFSNITVDGNGSRIERSGGTLMRAFAVGDASVNVNPGGTPAIVSGTGALTIYNLHVKGFYARGGNGGVGGGGGLGAGGAIFVRSGSLTVEGSTFEGNRAEGGNGGGGAHVGGGGGGGGLGGDGGSGVGLVYYFFQTSSGGGGGGARGDGGSAIYTGPDGQVKPAGQGGGGGGTVTNGEGTRDPVYGRAGGEACGGDGGDFQGDGADGCDGGGGGGGGEPYHGILCGVDGGGAGTGGYGGGGGGGGYGNFFSFVCSDVIGEPGGHGGFGGGGGAGATEEGGGDGGFGAGGGGGNSDGGAPGGTFGGHGGKDAGTLQFAVTGAGGGGAGLGGAIFSDRGHVTVRNSTFTGNSASHGFAGTQGDATSGATNGQDAGAGLFAVDGTLTIRNSTISGNEGTGADAGVAMYRSTRSGSSAVLVMTNTIVAANGAKECELIGSVSASGAGNLVTDNVDCPGVAVTDDPALSGLASEPAGATPTMAINAASSAFDSGDDATCEPVDQRGVTRPQSAACDIGAYEHASIPPTTTIALAPATPDGQNGWYVDAVGLTISATDPDSNVAQTRCALDPASVPGAFGDLPDGACAVTSVSADGEHVIYAASIDDADNAEQAAVSASFKIDSTEPTVSPSLNATSPITVGQSGVVASANATDDTSGVASSGCDAADTSSPGVHSITCTAMDNAGNQGSATLTYVVEYRILGFFEPFAGAKWKVGQSVPVKVALANGAGVRISDAEGAALAGACRVTFQAAGPQPKGPECLRYDLANHQFVYNWKLGRTGFGSATIVVRISYADTTVTTELSEAITITR